VREDGVLLLRTTTAPVDGKANAACIELLAEFFRVGRGQIGLVSGATGETSGLHWKVRLRHL
jgi:uncharacterized protein YggU (UPF0235/DUF167 family)